MTIEVTVSGSAAELRLIGWLDTRTSPELGAALEALMPDVSALMLDMAQLEYISSAGLRQILAAFNAMNGAVTLRHVSGEILNVLRMTGLDKRLRIEP